MTTKVEKQYNKFHSKYSQNLQNQNALSNSMFHEAIDIYLSKGLKVLDIGCGDGSDLQKLSIQGAIIHGIDPSEEFLDKARLNNPVGNFVIGVGEDLPYLDNYFDMVVSKWALQTSFDVPRIISEAGRVLKAKGILILLAKHPVMQWLEKIRDYGKDSDYYEQKVVTSNIYDGLIQLKEPTHTIGEYFNPKFFANFELLDYQERTDFPASEQIEGKIYPTFFLIKARKK